MAFELMKQAPDEGAIGDRPRTETNFGSLVQSWRRMRMYIGAQIISEFPLFVEEDKSAPR
ncbi:dipeptidyl peptidase 9 [Corchorus olitorius]|uniref:Dipeptidyl peptidase 9 n=1 Tax=Corchorus olitorius TaxID=93759 RepID=A0A1R3KJ34_9ROSI|nr:dipeptidyl peptidase 9 [Corchorus olitorius]